MNIWQSVQGMLLVEITNAEPERFLEILNRQEIVLFDVETVDALTIQFYVLRTDYLYVWSLCEKYGSTIRILRKKGLYWQFGMLMHRPVLVLGIIALLSLTFFLPTRIFFYSVEGNDKIADHKILEAAESCGILFGVSRREVRSERMKNALLAAVPELQWAGINTRGCYAVISVKERQPPLLAKSSTGITRIVAAQDGLITSCTVTSGNAVCYVGQSVQKDQLLISPYVDCGIIIKVEPVEGEIFAQTNRRIVARMPSEWMRSQEVKDEWKRYSVIIGKKRINLWKDSGISDAVCGRMYEEYCITLPGGFQVPVSLGIETLSSRIFSTEEISQESSAAMLKDFVSDYIRDQMVAGKVLQKQIAVTNTNGLCSLEASYVCNEMIGRILAERNGEINE